MVKCAPLIACVHGFPPRASFVVKGGHSCDLVASLWILFVGLVGDLGCAFIRAERSPALVPSLWKAFSANWSEGAYGPYRVRFRIKYLGGVILVG